MLAIVASAFALLTGCGEAIAPTSSLTPIAGRGDVVGCSPNAFIPCPDDTPGATTASSGIVVGYSFSQCTTPVQDTDGDGLEDSCEIALATAFAPMLMVHVGECGWDYSLNRVGGEYYYGVKRRLSSPSIVRIAYMPAYYRDCGSGGHTGDSEFILVDVAVSSSAPSVWRFQGAFLSAHCGGMVMSFDSDPDCQYWGPEFWGGGSVQDGLASHLAGTYVGGVARGAPVIHVSMGKHANYYSQDKCNNSSAAAAGVDACISPSPRRFPILYRWQNIDFPESEVWTGVGPRWGSNLPAPGAVERFNETVCGNSSLNCYTFNGWTGTSEGGGATPYGNNIRQYFDWWTTTFGFEPCTNYPHAFVPCAPG